MVYFGSPVFWQLQFLVESLSKQTYAATVQEVGELVELYGVDAAVFAIACLVGELDLRTLPDTPSSDPKLQLASSLVKNLWEQNSRSFGSCIRTSLEGALKLSKSLKGKKKGEQGLNAVQVELLCRKGLGLSTEQQLAVGVGLCQSAERSLSDEGAKFIVALLFGLLETTDKDVDIETVSEVVWVLKSHSMFLADSDLGSSCLLALESAFPKAFSKVQVAPFLVSDALCVDLLPQGEGWTSTLDCQKIVFSLSIDGFMEDFGPSCTASTQILKGIIEPLLEERKEVLNETDVASVIGMMARTQSSFVANASKGVDNSIVGLEMEFAKLSTISSGKEKSHKDNKNPAGNTDLSKGWDVSVFIQVAKELCESSLKGESVIQTILKTCSDLSMETLDAVGFALIVRAFKVLSNDKPLPGLLFVDISDAPGKLLKNKAAQMALLFHAVNSSPDDVFFSTAENRRPTISVANGVATSPNRAWESLDVVATLDSLAGSGFYHHVKLLFEDVVNRFPELLLLGLLQVTSPFDTLREETYALLLPKFLLSIHQNQEPVASKLTTVKQIWETNQSVLLRALVAMYARDSKFLPFIVDITVQQEDGLAKLLALPMPRLVYDAACFASRREPPVLNLERWLGEKLQASQKQGTLALQNLARSLLFILQLKTNPQHQQTAGLPLRPNELQTMFRCLQMMIQSRGLLPPEFVNEANHVYERIAQMAPAGVMDHTSTQPGPVNPTPPQPQPQQASAVAAGGAVQQVGQQASNPAAGMVGGDGKATSAEYVEQKANSLLQLIYKNPISAPEIVDLLKKLKNSDNQFEQDVFNCMVHNLLDEFRFLHKYPDKELVITGILFGVLIQHQLLSSVALGISLRYVLEALRKPPTSPMFRFGMIALEHFKSRLLEWPQTAAQVVQVEHLREKYPDFVREVESKLNLGNNSQAFPSAQDGLDPVKPAQPGVVTLGGATAVGVTGAPGVASNEPYPLRGTERSDDLLAALTAKLDELVGGPRDLTDPVDPPSSDVEDKITLIINNLSPRNVEEKAAEVKPLLKPDYLQWVAYYLVAKRVSTQANFHSVYMGFLDKLENKELLNHVRYRTLFTVRKLLRRNDIVSSTSERSILKNLGSWLGRLTLAKNKPLLHREVDLKGLLFDGYERGWLIAVVPFAAKILDGSKGTSVFTSTNPWIMRILRTLAELYQLADLKLNLKFEIEVLCKNLGVDLKVIHPTNALRTRRKPKFEGNPDFNFKSTDSAKRPNATPSPNLQVQQPSPSQQAELHAHLAGPQGQLPQSKPREGESKAADIPEHTVIPNLASYVHINPSLQLFTQQPTLRRVVPVAVDRAIREIIQPVVERSVTIACVTSKELVTKDFAMEPDEKKMRKAAHLMVSNLAGALALVTSKEPLRVSISNHLRTLLSQTTAREDQNLVEQVVQVAAAENLELGCMLIEKAATEKAMRDIDEQIEASLAARRDAREKRGQQFFDLSIFQTGGRFPNALPDHIRPTPNPNGLQPHQLLVYEAFQRNPRQAVIPPNRASVGAPPPAAGMKAMPVGAAAAVAAAAPGVGPGQQQQQPQAKVPGKAVSPSGSVTGTPTLTSQQALEKWRVVLSQLERSVQDLATQSPSGRMMPLARLPRDHEIMMLLREMRNIGAATLPAQRDDAAMLIVQHTFKRLYEFQAGDKLNTEVQLSVLNICRDLVKDPGALKKNLTEWVIFAPNEHRFNRTVAVGLIRNKLINMLEFDAHLAKLVDSRQAAAIGFAMDIIQDCVLVSRSVAVAELITTLDTLQKLVHLRNKQGAAGAQTPEIPGLQQLLDSVRMVASSEQQLVPGMFLRSNDPSGMRQQVLQLLQTWIQICSRSDGGAHESSHRPYLSLLQQQGILKGDENATRFFRITTELCVESSLTQSLTNSPQRNQTRKQVSYVAIDAFTKLVVLLVKYAEVRARLSLISLVLEVIAGVLCREFLLRKQRGVESGLDQRPYFRLFSNLQQDLVESYEAEGLGEEHVVDLLSIFSEVYDRLIQPRALPNFAFAWLELVSNKGFMPKLLRSKDGKGWLILELLLVDLLEFLHPFLNQVQLTPSIRMLYKGTLRVLLVLLHDFPEFLCSFHFSLCDAIPPSCIQLRNLILSAFPRSMQLPDPFTPNLKVDLLPEAQAPPNILSQVQTALVDHEVKQDLDTFLSSGQPVKFLADLKDRLTLDAGKGEYNVPLINSLVLYTGVYAIAQIKSLRYQPQNASLPLVQLLSQQASSLTALSVYEHLMNDMEPEGRYLCLNALANQLRFPSSHTHFFSCVLLHLFVEARNDVIREQITRVLLERLIVHRPHPWGLLITFMELIKNPRYRLREYAFTQCAPEIVRLFESVARSCMTAGGGSMQQNPSAQQDGGLPPVSQQG